MELRIAERDLYRQTRKIAEQGTEIGRDIPGAGTMEPFPIVKRKHVQKYSEYRTKQVILETYDKMAEAMKTGKPYQTILDPPPGPPADEQGNFLPLPEWLPGQPKPKDWPLHIHTQKGCQK